MCWHGWRDSQLVVWRHSNKRGRGEGLGEGDPRRGALGGKRVRREGRGCSRLRQDCHRQRLRWDLNLWQQGLSLRRLRLRLQRLCLCWRRSGRGCGEAVGPGPQPGLFAQQFALPRQQLLLLLVR